MTFRDILLPLFSYPSPQPEGALENAAKLVKRLGGEVTALALQVRIKPSHNRLANLLAGLDEVCREENAKNVRRAEEAVATWNRIAERYGLPSRARQMAVDHYVEDESLTRAARTRDICLVSVGPKVETDRSAAEAVLFGSGRPVLVFPEAALPLDDRPAFERIVLAWDGSRAAARAVGDALPFLGNAREVRVLTVTGEKATAGPAAAADLLQHLAAHNVHALVDEVGAGGRPIGAILDHYMALQHADLLVMGGFGHSRARDFVLGGATKSVLSSPAYPVFLSH